MGTHFLTLTVPRRIIGVCASYLDQISYAALSGTNRSSYLGCNGPNMLSEVNLYHRHGSVNEYPDFSAFPFATKLWIPAIGSYDEMRVIASQMSKMPRLHSLDLRRSGRNLIKMICNHDVINGRIKSVVFSHEDLDLTQAGEIRRCQRFIQLMALFKHIQFLKVRFETYAESSVPEDEWKTETLIKSLSNLKGLDFDDGGYGIEWNILQSIGHRLEYLALHDIEQHFLNSAEQKQINFVNLRQLWQRDWCVSDSIRTIVKTAVHLEKVRLSNWSDLLEDVLTQCDELKYLEIDAFEGNGHGGLENVLEKLERCLFSKKTIQKDSLKIRINTSFAAIAKSEEYIIKLNRIMKTLSGNNVDQWMPILHIKRNDEQENNQCMEDVARVLKSGTFNIAVLGGDDSITASIRNPDCTICGYRESWLMDP